MGRPPEPKERETHVTRVIDAANAQKNRRVDFVIAALHDVETAVSRQATPTYDVPHARLAVTSAGFADVCGLGALRALGAGDDPGHTLTPRALDRTARRLPPRPPLACG